MVADPLTKPIIRDVYSSHVRVMGLDFVILSAIYDRDLYFTSLKLY